MQCFKPDLIFLKKSKAAGFTYVIFYQTDVERHYKTFHMHFISNLQNISLAILGASAEKLAHAAKTCSGFVK